MSDAIDAVTNVSWDTASAAVNATVTTDRPGTSLPGPRLHGRADAPYPGTEASRLVPRGTAGSLRSNQRVVSDPGLPVEPLQQLVCRAVLLLARAEQLVVRVVSGSPARAYLSDCGSVKLEFVDADVHQ